MAPRPAARVILHLDMDAFYAAVEARDNPALAGKPLIVGHRGRRGVVSTCSYEARRFGVHSAMPSLTAERLCPKAIWLPVRMDLYVAVSQAIRAIMSDFTPVIEPLSIDEAFLDLTGGVADLQGGRLQAQRLKDRIRAEERLTASVGVAPNKYLAKVASDLEKPDGLVVLAAEDVPVRLWPLPVERLWGVGPRTARPLRAAGFATIGDVRRADPAALAAIVGKGPAAHLQALASGEDDRPVDPGRDARSISEERTYAEDLHEDDAIDRALLARAEGVGRELRRAGLRARTIHLKVRISDFTTWTRALTLKQPTDLTEPIVAAVRMLFRERIRLGKKGVRLLGVGATGLVTAGAPAAGEQARLFSDPVEERARRAARATDMLRERLGESAVTRARLLRRRPARRR